MSKPLHTVDSSVKPMEWAKHLRPFGKRKIHKKVRAKVKNELQKESIFKGVVKSKPGERVWLDDEEGRYP